MELIVRNGKFFTVGDNGAGFYKYQKNDVIFSAKQTEELFKYGNAISNGGRGKVFLNGTAFSSGTGKIRGKGTVTVEANEEDKYEGESYTPTSHDEVKYNYDRTVRDYTPYTPKTTTSTSSSSSGEKEKEIRYETINFIEILLNRIERGIEKIKKRVENIFSTFSARNENLKREIEEVSSAINSKQMAASVYGTYAESVELSSYLKEKVRSGSYDISDYEEDVAKQINLYKDYYEKMLDCEQGAEDLERSLKELYKQQFDMTAKNWSDALEKYSHTVDRINSQIGQRKSKASDYLAGKNGISAAKANIESYQSIVETQQQQLKDSKKELEELNYLLQAGVYNGVFAIGSEAYNEMLKSIHDVENEIDSLNENIIENTNNVAGSYKDIFDGVNDYYANIIGLANKLSEQYSAEMELASSKGLMASTRYYQLMHKQQENNLVALKKEQQELSEALNTALQSGTIERGSKAWYEMTEQIIECNKAIIETTKTINEYDKAMREVQWDRFDYLQERIAEVTEESQFLVDLLNNNDLFDERGSMTNEGLTVLGIYAADYNTFMRQADDYARAIENLNAEIANDPANTTLLERREKLLKLQRESIKSAEAEKQAIKKLVEDGINAELSSMKKLITSYNDGLQRQKDLYDYNKKISEQTKNVSNLQKMLAAYQNDVTEETRAKIQKMQVELQESQETLRETEYENYISEQKKILDNMYDDYEEMMNQRLDNIDTLVSDMIDVVNDNSLVIADTIKEATSIVGYNVTDDLATMMAMDRSDIKDIAAMYGDAFSSNLTTTNEALNRINDNIIKLISAADNGAISLTSGSLNGYASGAKSVSGGYAWTNEHWNDGGAETILRKSDHAILTPLSSGSRIYNALASNNLWSMANNPSKFILDNLAAVAQSSISRQSNNSSNINQTNSITINLDNVQDYDTFIAELKNDSKFQKFIQAITIDPLSGKSINQKRRINL